MNKLSTRLRVLGAVTALSVIVTFTISTAAQNTGPPNDMFDAAITIEGSSGYLHGSNFEATLEPSEPGTCANCKTVWYRWTAPANLSMTFELPMPTRAPEIYLTDTVMGVYMGSTAASLTMLTWNDDISMERGNRHSRVTFAARAGQVYNIRIYGGYGTEGTFILSWDINGAESWKQFNFDGCSTFESRNSDFGVFRPSDGSWWLNSDSSAYKTVAWGVSNDIPVPGDYFGDGCSDIAIWRPSDGMYWILDNPSGAFVGARWGMEGDTPVVGDFDGDDKADLAIYRGGDPVGGVNQFWILNSSDGSLRVESIWPWSEGCYPGACYLSPFTADYDGDGKTDLGLTISYCWDGCINQLAIRKSSDGSYEEFDLNYGRAVRGDFDNDGKSDMAGYSRGYDDTFVYRRSSDGSFTAFRWGVGGDIPVSGDYGGSRGSDLCVWRPSDGNVYCHDPIGQTNWQFKWGKNGDRPLSAN
jgi:hypothetical protein